MQDSKMTVAQAAHTGCLPPQLAEPLLLKAVHFAEIAYGKESADTGSCLMELADFYENQGNFKQHQIATARYVAILQKLAIELGIS